MSPLIAEALLGSDPSLGSVKEMRDLLKTQFPPTTRDVTEDDMFDAEIVVFQSPLFVFGFGQDMAEPGGDVELSGACPGALYLRQLHE